MTNPPVAPPAVSNLVSPASAPAGAFAAQPNVVEVVKRKPAPTNRGPIKPNASTLLAAIAGRTRDPLSAGRRDALAKLAARHQNRVPAGPAADVPVVGLAAVGSKRRPQGR